MTSLHAALEQERSKVKVLQAELAKYQVCFYNFESVFITNNALLLGQNLFAKNINNFIGHIIYILEDKIILDIHIYSNN